MSKKLPNKLFGAEIVPVMAHRLEDAIKQKHSLYDFASASNMNGLQSWLDHMREKNVPCVVVNIKNASKDSKKRFVLLKRFFCYDPEAKESKLKTCKCNPLDGTQFCRECAAGSYLVRARGYEKVAV